MGRTVTLLDRPDVTVRSVDCPGPIAPEPSEVVGPDRYELCLVRQGCFHVRGSKHADVFVDPTTCILGEPRHAVEVTHPYPDGDVNTMVLLSRNLLGALGGETEAVPAEAPVTGEVAWLHQRLLSEARRDGDAATTEELTVLLVAEVIDRVEPARVAAGRPPGRTHQQLADGVRAALVADPTIPGVVELARLLGCSPHHLSRIFAQQTGMGIARYRMALRTARAVDAIAEGETDLSRLAVRFGFSDHAHLTRAVRSSLGRTPSAIRATLRDKTAGMGQIG